MKTAARIKPVRTRDLPQGDTTPRQLLKCFKCSAEYSANRGDYFLEDPNEVMTHCNAPLALVTKREVFEMVEI